jgi:cellulose synthase/poly-beta-1,6-N-acetylglucosamine synthase-like glycosyltransferase
MDWSQSVGSSVLWFNRLVLGYYLVLNTTYLILFLLSLGAVLRFVRRTFFADYRQLMQSEMTWPISIVVAAHNEEKTIVETVRSLMMVNYGEFEIVVVNDDSGDGTLRRLIDAFELRRLDKVFQRSIPTEPVRGVWGSRGRPAITVVDKVRGGKSDALNAGINVCRYPLFCSIDADSIIEENSLLRVVKHFLEHPEETIAAGGIVRVVNGCRVRDGRVVQIELPDRSLPIFQVVEYLRAFLSGRVGWSVLQSLLIISGAFGVYRRQEVIEVGGYSRETDTEDLDLVIRLHRHMRRKRRPYRVVFVPDPVCWTEVPETLAVLRRQRARWHRGLVQSLWDHRSIMFNPRYGSLGLLGFPHAFFFEMLGPFVEILGYVVVLASFAVGLLDVEFFLLFFAAAVVYGVFLSIAAVLLEEISFRRYPGWIDLSKLIVFAVLENFGFRQMLSLFKIKAFYDVVRRHRAWGRMQRTGFRRPVDAGATPGGGR